MMRSRRKMKSRNPIKMMNQTSFRISDGPSSALTPFELISDPKFSEMASIDSESGGEKGPPPMAVKALTRTVYDLPKVKLSKMIVDVLDATSVSEWTRVSFLRTSTCKHE
jgi:hypothetical protein